MRFCCQCHFSSSKNCLLMRPLCDHGILLQDYRAKLRNWEKNLPAPFQSSMMDYARTLNPVILLAFRHLIISQTRICRHLRRPLIKCICQHIWSSVQVLLWQMNKFETFFFTENHLASNEMTQQSWCSGIKTPFMTWKWHIYALYKAQISELFC